MGNTRYYTKTTGQTFAELQYDAWGQPVSPNKLANNDHGNYVFATFTGHIYDTTLDIYFAEARFYDATNRTWLAMDPIKDGLNWYQYVNANPITYWDALGLSVNLPPVPNGVDPSHNAWYLITDHNYGVVHRAVQEDAGGKNNLLIEQGISGGYRVDLVERPLAPDISGELEFWEVKPSSYTIDPFKHGLLENQLAQYENQTITINGQTYDLVRAQTRIPASAFVTQVGGKWVTVNYWNSASGEVYYTFQPIQGQPEYQFATAAIPSIVQLVISWLQSLGSNPWGTPALGGDSVLTYNTPYDSCSPSSGGAQELLMLAVAALAAAAIVA